MRRSELKKIILTILIIVCGAVFLFAGDTAVFVDLGFSPDCRTYAFAQYGIQSGSLRPWAELFIVDVASNNFVNGGRLSFVHDSAIRSGQDGSGALYRLISQNTAITNRHNLNFLFLGSPLFISLEEPASPPRQNIEFRDFEAGSSYRASLVSTVGGTGSNLTSSFFISLERRAGDGSLKNYTVGSPAVKRQGIDSYRIRKVLISPNDSSMIFIIEMKKQSGADYDIRFMVEALRL